MADAQLLQFPAPRAGAAEDEGDLRAARSGDVRAFEALYRHHVARIYALCLRMTGQPSLAEDCTQECFISAWRALAGFKATVISLIHLIHLLLRLVSIPPCRLDGSEAGS